MPKHKRAKVRLIVHEPDPEPKPVRQIMTAADRRNWFRRQAGWPELKESSN